jgi:hypothetical protein
MSQLNQQMRERNHELRIRLAKKKKEDEIDRQLKLQVNFTHWKILGKLKLWEIILSGICSCRTKRTGAWTFWSDKAIWYEILV